MPFIKKLLLYSIPAIVLGGFFLWLNYARFGNIFEFGHNFLPASQHAEFGQFSIRYARDHLRIMLFRIPTQVPIFSTRDGIFQPIAIWIVSPLVIIYGIFLAYTVRRKIKYDDFFEMVHLILIPFLITLHLLILASHKDVGGPQFGYRYSLDVLPVMFFGLVAILSKIRMGKNVLHYSLPLFIIGFVVNILGTLHSLGVR